MISKAVRSLAWAVYSISQTRAQVVIDPVLLGLAKALLADTPRPSDELMAYHVPDDLYPSYRETVRKVRYHVEDWDFSEARPELLTENQRRMIHTAALGESAGSPIASFLYTYRALPEMRSFFVYWLVEEQNHYEGLHRYLERMGESWTPEYEEAVNNVPFRPYSEDPNEVTACQMYQELVGYLSYRSLARQAGDPFLSRMMHRFAKDELRHYKFFQEATIRHIQRNPGFRAVVLKAFLKAVTPLNQTATAGEVTANEHFKNGTFYFRKAEFDFYSKQLEFLLGKDLSWIFEWMTTNRLSPCTICARELLKCECERYDFAGGAPSSAAVEAPLDATAA